MSGQDRKRPSCGDPIWGSRQQAETVREAKELAQPDQRHLVDGTHLPTGMSAKIIGTLRQLNKMLWVSTLGQFWYLSAPKYWATKAVLKPMIPIKKETKAKEVKPPLKQAFIASALICFKYNRSINISIASVEVEIINGKAMWIMGVIPPRPWSACNNFVTRLWIRSALKKWLERL